MAHFQLGKAYEIALGDGSHILEDGGKRYTRLLGQRGVLAHSARGQ